MGRGLVMEVDGVESGLAGLEELSRVEVWDEAGL